MAAPPPAPPPPRRAAAPSPPSLPSTDDALAAAAAAAAPPTTTPPAFAAPPPPPPSTAPSSTTTIVTAATTAAASGSAAPHGPPRCEGCTAPHAGTYGSGRFCSATCAKKVGARHKWATRAAAAPGAAPRAPAARRAAADAPCECCSKLHDKSYGSGRFCSVHCARRVAATRKWEKSRSEKSKRLEAIRPAMLAAPPSSATPCALPVWTGKRRRVVASDLEQLHISDTAPSFYVTPPYSLPQPLNLPTNTPPPPVCATPPLPQRMSAAAAAAAPASARVQQPHASYLPPQPALANHAVHYSQSIAHAGVPFARHVVYAAHAALPAYSVPRAHGCDGASTMASRPWAVTQPRCVQPRTPLTMCAAGALPRAYVVANGGALQLHMVAAGSGSGGGGSGGGSGGGGGATAVAPRGASGVEKRAVKMPAARGEKRVENSESAARALLCLRETSGSETCDDA